MPEHTTFEVRFRAAIQGYVGGIASDLDPVELARHIASRQPRRHGLAETLRSRGVAALRRSWVLLLLVTLLLAVVAGMLVAGSPERILPVVVPPIVPAAACPAGSNPDAPGPVGQARPAAWHWSPMAFDRRAGRLVVLVGAEVSPVIALETWTFDVCTNTWAQMHPNREPPPQISGLVYDVDSDVTIGVHYEDWQYPEVIGSAWAYDLEANTWTERGIAPTESPSFHDPVTGLVVADSEVGPWNYDVETDTWTLLRHASGPAGISVYDASVNRVIGFNGLGQAGGETWRGDIRTGAWSRSAVETPVFWMGWWAVPPSVYDEAAERTLVAGNVRWATYDATRDRWEVVIDAGDGGTMPGAPKAYDPVNRRLIVAGPGPGVEGDLVAFDLVTREWTVLLETR